MMLTIHIASANLVNMKLIYIYGQDITKRSKSYIAGGLLLIIIPAQFPPWNNPRGIPTCYLRGRPS